MLDERKLKAIENIIKGEQITVVAKLSVVSRQTVYDWLADDEFKAELDRSVQEIRNSGQQRLNSKLTTYLDELEKIALTDKSTKVRSDTLEYLIDRVLGRTTSKIADVTDEEADKDKISSEQLEDEFKKYKTVIDINEVKQEVM